MRCSSVHAVSAPWAVHSSHGKRTGFDGVGAGPPDRVWVPLPKGGRHAVADSCIEEPGIRYDSRRSRTICLRLGRRGGMTHAHTPNAYRGRTRSGSAFRLMLALSMAIVALVPFAPSSAQEEPPATAPVAQTIAQGVDLMPQVPV